MAKEYFLMEEIGYMGLTASRFMAEIEQYKEEKLDIYIQSPGGDVFQGLAIYDAIKRRSKMTTTIITGCAASMASIIALAADKVKMTASAYYMIHNPMTWAAGNADDISKEIELLRKLEDTMITIYTQKCSATAEQVRAWMASEKWFTADEALQYGFIDTIVDDDRAHGRAVALSGAVWDKFQYRNTPASLKQKQTKGVTMNTENIIPEAKEQATERTYTEAEVQARLKTETEQAVKVERNRVAQIRSLAFPGQEKLVETMIADNMTADAAAVRIIADYKENGIPAQASGVETAVNLLDRHATAPVPVAEVEIKDILAEWQSINNPIDKTAFYREHSKEIEKAAKGRVK